MENNKMATISFYKDLLVTTEYRELTGPCKLVLFELAVFGGKGRVDVYQNSVGSKHEKILDLLAQKGYIKITGNEFQLTCPFLKADDTKERVKRSRIAKRDLVSAELDTIEVTVPSGPMYVCPYQEIADAYNSILTPELVRISTLTDPIKRVVKLRWMEAFKLYKQTDKEGAIQLFKWFFQQISKNEFYVRKTDKYKSGTHSNWRPDFVWLMKTPNILRDECDKMLSQLANK